MKKTLSEDATPADVYEYFRDCLGMESLGEALRDADLSGGDLMLLERMSEETRRRLCKLTTLQRRRVRKVMGSIDVTSSTVSSKIFRSYLLHVISVCLVLLLACFLPLSRQEDTNSTLLVVAGLEGTGHHMWHQYVFPDLSRRVHSEYVEHFDEYHHMSRRLKRVTKYPAAFEPNHTDTKLFTYGKDSLSMLTNMFTLMQSRSESNIKHKLYILDICSFPCGPSRTHGHDPDLIMIREAAKGADPPLNFRVLLQWRDPIEAVASATTNRKCCYVGDTLAVPLQAHVLRTSLMHMNNQLRTIYHTDKDSEVREMAVLDYNKFVNNITLRDGYIHAMSKWLNLPEDVKRSLFESVNAKVRKPSVRWADQFTTQESDYLSEIFHRSTSLWQYVDAAVKNRDLLLTF